MTNRSEIDLMARKDFEMRSAGHGTVTDFGAVNERIRKHWAMREAEYNGPPTALLLRLAGFRIVSFDPMHPSAFEDGQRYVVPVIE